MTYEQAVKELYYSVYGTEPTNFHSDLYRLITKADMGNKILLRIAYPVEVQVWEDWQNAKSPVEFFKKFGLGVRG